MVCMDTRFQHISGGYSPLRIQSRRDQDLQAVKGRRKFETRHAVSTYTLETFARKLADSMPEIISRWRRSIVRHMKNEIEMYNIYLEGIELVNRLTTDPMNQDSMLKMLERQQYGTIGRVEFQRVTRILLEGMNATDIGRSLLDICRYSVNFILPTASIIDSVGGLIVHDDSTVPSLFSWTTKQFMGDFEQTHPVQFELLRTASFVALPTIVGSLCRTFRITLPGGDLELTRSMDNFKTVGHKNPLLEFANAQTFQDQLQMVGSSAVDTLKDSVNGNILQSVDAAMGWNQFPDFVVKHINNPNIGETGMLLIEELTSQQLLSPSDAIRSITNMRTNGIVDSEQFVSMMEYSSNTFIGALNPLKETLQATTAYTTKLRNM